MKLNKKIIVGMIIVLVISLFSYTVNAVAAAATLSATETNVNVGDTVTVTATATAGAFNLTLSGAGQEKQIVGFTDTTDNVKKTASITFTATEAKRYTFTLTGDYTDFYSETDSATPVNKQISIDASVPSQSTDNGGGSSGNSGSGSSSTTNKPTPTPAKTLNFKDDSKTVYVKGNNTNLRANWNTTDGAIQVNAGTELRLTGVSTEKVDGHTWYRVTYEGKIKYVRSDLVTDEKPEEKSSNVNLKSLDLEGIEISPKFSNDVTEYTAKIEDFKEKQIKVTAEPEDDKTSIRVEGNENIKTGENKIKVAVIAEDGTTRNYIIVVTVGDEKIFGLATIKIDGKEISGFATDKFNYEYKFENLDKLDIKAIANEEDATIEILGNEDLHDGENTITIVVTSKDGEKTATYQIKANKGAIVQKTEKKFNLINIIISVLIALIVLIIIILLILKYVGDKEELEDNEKSNRKNRRQNENEFASDDSEDSKKSETFDYESIKNSIEDKKDVISNEDMEVINREKFNRNANEDDGNIDDRY